MALAAGSRLGPYEILSPLGAGGMGEVYRARDTRLGREVAIKVLPSGLAAHPERLKRFEREARSASGLSHPNIVTIYDFGREGETSYIAMELVGGESLRAELLGGPVSVRRLLQVAIQLADGLAKAHGLGIVHRDLKPENIMVSEDGHVKILDFGLAKLTQPEGSASGRTQAPTVSGGTEEGVILGTVGYMSPEQARGDSIDFRSDQFSFGSILYEMATGQRAFQRASAPQTLAAIIQDEPEPIGGLNPRVPAPVRWIVERCLAKVPRNRYASTEDLARELATVRDHLSEASSAVGALAPGKPAPRLGRLRIAVLAALAIAAGAVLSHLLWRPAKPDPPTFRRLTFRHGNLTSSARFAPDGRTVVYGASWEGQPYEIYTTRPEGPESIPMGLKNADLFSVSRSGELAISLGFGTLATLPMGGGAPRPIAEFVQEADWTPDGKQLAVLRRLEGRNRIELPLGKVIYATQFRMYGMRISPRGDRIAFYENTAPDWWSLRTVDLAGNSKTLMVVRDDMAADRVAWTPRGEEIWFCDSGDGGERTGRVVLGGRNDQSFFLRAVDLEGRVRIILSSPIALAVRDISRDGRVLVYLGILGLAPGEAGERELTWFGMSSPQGLSDDGRTLLIQEDLGLPTYYLRKTDGSPAVKLGEGRAIDLSADGRWVLAQSPDSEKNLVLVPTGTGTPVTIEEPGFETVGAAALFPDGKRMLIRGAEPGRKPRLYVQELPSGKPRPITERGFYFPGRGMSPAGDWFAVRGDIAEDLSLVPTAGGEPRTIPGTKDLGPVGWTPDGRFLFASVIGSFPARVVRVEVATGKREPWKDLAPSDQSITGIGNVFLTPDGKSYVYGYRRVQVSDLFVVEGLK
jgi:hypothetical protein